MFARVLKILGIVGLCGVFLFGAVEFWVYKNRETIFLKVKELVNDRINGNLEIEDIKFRPFHGQFGLNFALVNVKLTDSLYQKHKIPFLEAANIRVSLDLKNFYTGNIKIKNLIVEDATLHIFKQRDGYSNLTIFSSGKPVKDKTEKETDSMAKRLGNLQFHNFQVTYQDSVRQNYFGALFHDAVNTIAETDSGSIARLTGTVLFDGLTFKPKKGGFLNKQETNVSFVVGFDEDEQVLRIFPSVLETTVKDKILISGEFDFADTLRTFRMNFEAEQIEVDNAVKLLSKRLREQIDSIGVHTKVNAKVKVAGQLAGKQPKADVYFRTNTFKYELPVGTLRDMKAEGVFTNQSDTAKEASVANSRLVAPNITGKFETVPFNLNLSVFNFFNPTARLDGYVSADSTNLDGLLDPSRYRFKNGSARVEFHFDGSLKKFYDAKTDRFNGKLWGKTSVNNISIDYLPRQVHLRQIKGDFTFNEKVFVFPNLRLSDGQNMMYVRGQIVDLIPYLFGSPKILSANVDITIPNWQLNWLESLLAPRKVPVKRKKRLKLADLLDDAIDQMEVVAKLDAKKLRYRNLTASNVKGQFTIRDNAMNLEYFVMKAFGGGNVRISGQMDNSGASKYPHIAVKGKIANANVHSVFYSFDDFSQKTITHNNLKGRLSTDFNFEANIDNNIKLIPSSMSGLLHINLTNGHIINFEPFMKMKKLIFKKRNFEEVKLAPIRNEFRLKGQEIFIAPMEIESNVVTLFIDGIYSFGNKTDINIGIPLSNLKKRDSTYVLDPNNPDKKEGPKIFLRAVDENGEVNIKLAFRKKKDKDKSRKEEEELDPESIEK
ncbi:AsmA-like C-terminal region-containing protein [Dyadobacter sandarakinus]|uniref:AsmA-like C-terminal region n=1 Tax=Dyadobacter sandarakinus TaxID=2747268 RepID=A0ABX7IA90_9BACT|nr:AsmA-like C-terminal region-containing protein [Dyadobacter sandarakinus]QRR02638.1 hypothetical protein HWI92_17825 [Dyadobacter sandarakinus]